MARKWIWLLTLLCMAFIFYMSARPVEASRGDSARLISALRLVDEEEALYTNEDWAVFQLHNRIRKIAHIVLYAGLGMLYFASIYGYFGGIGVSGGLAVLLTALYGAIDEIHQIFSHRGAAFGDVLFDALGGLIGVVIVGAIFFVIEKNARLKTFFSRLYDFEPKTVYKLSRRIPWKKLT